MHKKMLKGKLGPVGFILIVCVASSAPSVESGDPAGDECHGINPDNFNTTIFDSSFNEKLLLPALNNQLCYCKDIDMRALCPLTCMQCDSDPVRCQAYGMCCSSKQFGATTALAIKKPTPNAEVGASHPKVMCYNARYLVVKSCPPGYHNDVTRKLCEERLPPREMTKAALLVVTDTKTNVAYYNRYCAQCNNAQKIIEWKPAISCLSYLYVHSATTELELMRLSLEPMSNCIITQKPVTRSLSCDWNFYRELVNKNTDVVKCADSDTSDRLLEACEDSPYDGQLRIFCPELAKEKDAGSQGNGAISGGPDHIGDPPAVPFIDGEPEKTKGNFEDYLLKRPPPFQFMFGLGSDGGSFSDRNLHKISSGCRENQWKDPKGNCRQVVCAEGKILNEGECATAMSVIKGLPYKFQLILTYLGQHNFSEKVLSLEELREKVTYFSANPVIVQQLDQLSEKNSVKFNKVGFGDACSSRDGSSSKNPHFVPKFIIADVHLTSAKNERHTRDAIETQMIDLYHNATIEFPFKYIENTSIKYQTQFVHNTVDVAACPFGLICDYFKPPDIKFALNKSDFIAVRPYLMCPYVKLFANEVNMMFNPWPIPDTSKIVFDFGYNATVEITESSEINLVHRGVNGTSYVCLELLLKYKLPSLETSIPLNSLFDVIQHALTGVCVSASLVCLFAVICTYGLFPSLRCVAGCNTLGLSCSLFVSQLLLLVGNAIPGPSVLCTVTGVISHYSWLVMFTWTFLCCLHMLRVFTSIKGHSKAMSKRSETRAIAFNVALSFLVPASIVVIIIVINVVMSHVTLTIGYGSFSCGVDNVYTIYAPLIFVNVSSVVFFVIVVIKIWSVRRLQRADESRKDFVIYVKLSTLTGMFWLLVILGEVLKNDVIRCLAVISNGTQGVFIFASFVANRRVKKLYADRFNLEWLSSETTLSSAEGSRIATVQSQIARRVTEKSSTDFDCVGAGDE